MTELWLNSCHQNFLAIVWTIDYHELTVTVTVTYIYLLTVTYEHELRTVCQSAKWMTGEKMLASNARLLATSLRGYCHCLLSTGTNDSNDTNDSKHWLGAGLSALKRYRLQSSLRSRSSVSWVSHLSKASINHRSSINHVTVTVSVTYQKSQNLPIGKNLPLAFKSCSWRSM